MKKLLVVLLALGLIVAFGTTASATNIEFSGQWYAVGVYESNRTMQDTDSAYSKAYVWTRTGSRPSSRSPKDSPSPPGLTPSNGSGAPEPQQQQHRRQVQLR